MARLGGTPITLTASGDTTIDSTATARSGRVRVYNNDTVVHTYTFKVGTTPLDKETALPAGQSRVFGPENFASGQNPVINVAEATTTSASTAIFTGEDDS